MLGGTRRVLLAPGIGLLLSLAGQVHAAPVTVTPVLTTDPVAVEGRDVSIWVHPTQPAKSLVVAADLGNTTTSGGLFLFDLAGKKRASIASGQMVSSSVLYDVPLGGSKVDIVVGAERKKDKLLIYQLDGSTPALKQLGAAIFVGVEIKGACAYRSTAGKYYAFVTDALGGTIEQWELVPAAGAVTGVKRRTLKLSSVVKGCTVDAATKSLFVAEQNPGVLWRFGSEPGSTTKTKIEDTTAGHFSGDLENLAVYRAAANKGYLLAASQGTNTYAIYERASPNRYVGSLSVAGATRGVGVYAEGAALGSTFPKGALVVNDGGKRFKLSRWDAVAALFSPALIVDTSVDPRGKTSGADGGVPAADGGTHDAGGATDGGPAGDAGRSDAARSDAARSDAARSDAPASGGKDDGGPATGCRSNDDCPAEQSCVPERVSCAAEDRCTIVAARCRPRTTTRLGCSIARGSTDDGSWPVLVGLLLAALLRRRRRPPGA